jgi:hypothetical protein
MKRIFFSILLTLGVSACNLPGFPVETTSPPITYIPPASSSLPGTVDTQAPFDGSLVVVGSDLLEGVAYTTYQIPGDPFRFVCQSPCQLSQDYIYAEYAGFRPAHARLIQILGIDTLPELQPVDMHLELMNSICSEQPSGHAYIYADRHQAYTCTEGPGWYPTQEEVIQKAALAGEQYFPLHEYMHTIFFGRISGRAGDFMDYKAEFFHDYVVSVPSYATGGLDPSIFCTFHDGVPTGDYDGWLIPELCRRNGFQFTHLSESLVALDRLYQTGAGVVPTAGYEHPVPSVAQYRDILNTLLGSDTTPAFAAACWPPELFDNSYTSPAGCLKPTSEGTSTPLK